MESSLPMKQKKLNPDLKIGLFESGNSLERRKCPIDGVKIKSCINCKTCGIMNGFGGAGAFLMENTTSQMNSVVLCMNMLEKRSH